MDWENPGGTVDRMTTVTSVEAVAIASPIVAIAPSMIDRSKPAPVDGVGTEMRTTSPPRSCTVVEAVK